MTRSDKQPADQADRLIDAVEGNGDVQATIAFYLESYGQKLDKIGEQMERMAGTLEYLVPLLSRLSTTFELAELRKFAESGMPAQMNTNPPDPKDPMSMIPAAERYRFEGVDEEELRKILEGGG